MQELLERPNGLHRTVLIVDDEFIERKMLGAMLQDLYANLSLTPLTKPVSEMTELLRSRTDTDYSALMEEAAAQFARLCSL